MTHEGLAPCCVPGLPGASSKHRDVELLPPVVGPRGVRQVRVPGGVTSMGDPFGDGDPNDGETPVHPVRLRDFSLDATAVTNDAFAEFVDATGHVTDAEDLGLSAVFEASFAGDPRDVLGRAAHTPWWLVVEGATWRAPEGPGSDLSDRGDHPVVQVSWNDARAYAAWAGKRLPSEAEWEYAARGGTEGRRYPWGDELKPGGEWRCNIWQGVFPSINHGDDGHLATAPAAAFEPNGYGLHQMVGNVWEWCADWFDAHYYEESPPTSPTGPVSGTARVMRGGSFLCHDSYCNRYRVAARSRNTPDSASGNLGFRCASRAEGPESP